MKRLFKINRCVIPVYQIVVQIYFSYKSVVNQAVYGVHES